MTKYHATLTDECGDEYVATLEIDDGVENVSEYIRDMYPEWRLMFVEPAHGASLSKAQAHAVWQARWEDLY